MTLLLDQVFGFHWFWFLKFRHTLQQFVVGARYSLGNSGFFAMLS